jgi:enoyl-CoA hydratase/carnithine racemase
MTENADRAVLTVRREAGVAWVSIDNPPLNLLDMRLALALDGLSRELEADEGVRVIVFESAVPDHFLAHADMRLLQQMRDSGAYPDTGKLGLYSQMLERFRTMGKATIAKVEGRARGGGAEFVLAMDMVFASPTARFSQMEILLGINPGAGGAQYLTRKVGRSKALELCLSGGDVGGDDAVSYGYANRILPSETLGQFVETIARRIASFPGDAVALNKANILMAEAGVEGGLLEAGRTFARLVTASEFDRRVETFIVGGGQTAAGEYEDLSAHAEALALARVS